MEQDVNERLYIALKRIASYDSPGKINRYCEREQGPYAGLRTSEAIEMAYENVIEEAKFAIRGIRIKKKAESRAAESHGNDGE